jgi:hypothetical protein
LGTAILPGSFETARGEGCVVGFWEDSRHIREGDPPGLGRVEDRQGKAAEGAGETVRRVVSGLA